MFTPDQLHQALAILDREQPSSAENRRFRWLIWAVWSVFGFSSLWLVVVQQEQLGRGQIVPLVMALVAAAAVPVLFLSNLSLLRKFWKAVRTERRLGVSRYVSALTAKVRSQARWSARAEKIGLIALFPIGLVFVRYGGLALKGELWDSPLDFRHLPLPLWLFTLGMTCLCLYPMEVCRQRLDALARLRATVLKSTDDDATRELIRVFERRRIVIARQESATSSARARGTGGVRLTRAFRESLTKLSPDDIARVYAALPRLRTHKTADDPSGFGTRAGLFDVPETSLRIAFTRNIHSDEIALGELQRTDGKTGLSGSGVEGSER